MATNSSALPAVAEEVELDSEDAVAITTQFDLAKFLKIAFFEDDARRLANVFDDVAFSRLTPDGPCISSTMPSLPLEPLQLAASHLPINDPRPIARALFDDEEPPSPLTDLSDSPWNSPARAPLALPSYPKSCPTSPSATYSPSPSDYDASLPPNSPLSMSGDSLHGADTEGSDASDGGYFSERDPLPSTSQKRGLDSDTDVDTSGASDFEDTAAAPADGILEGQCSCNVIVTTC